MLMCGATARRSVGSGLPMMPRPRRFGLVAVVASWRATQPHALPPFLVTAALPATTIATATIATGTLASATLAANPRHHHHPPPPPSSLTPSSQKLKDDAVAAAGGGGVRIEVGEGGGGEDGTPSIVVRIDSHLFGL